MRRWIIVLFLLCGSCATVDLRDDAMQTLDPEGKLGRSWLQRALTAHGGSAVKRGQVVSVVMSDAWPHWFRTAMVGPWDDDVQKFRLDYVVGRDDGRITFLNGDEQGLTIGIQNWRTYRRASGSAEAVIDPADSVDERTKFWVPTVAYFVLLPWRLVEADTVHYMGKTEVGDTSYARVFVTWGGPDLSDEVDQYEVLIDTTTGLIRYVSYTVRDFGDFVRGTMSYDEYLEVGGAKFGKVMQTVDEPGDTETNLHRMVVESVELKSDVPLSALYPAPDQRAPK